MEYNLATELPKNKDQLAWFYNGIDCLITYEILEELKEQLTNEPDNVRGNLRICISQASTCYGNGTTRYSG